MLIVILEFRKTLFLAITVLLLNFGGTAMAAGESALEKDMQQEKKISQVEIDEELIPLRLVLEEIGVVDLVWEQEKARILFNWNSKEVVLYIDKREAVIDGEMVDLTLPPVIREGRTLVPADFFEVYLPIELDWSLMNEEQDQRQQIVNTALQYLGVPYSWGGVSPSGFDSSGFIWYVFQENGIQLPRVSSDMYQAGMWIAKDQLLPGDLVFFRGYLPGSSHGSIYIGEDKFVHSPSTGKTVSVGNLDDPYYWGPRYFGARRIIDI